MYKYLVCDVNSRGSDIVMVNGCEVRLIVLGQNHEVSTLCDVIHEINLIESSNSVVGTLYVK